MSADEEIARMEHRRLNGSSRLTARASCASAAPALRHNLRERIQKADTASAMDTDDDSTYQAPSSVLQSQTKGASLPFWQVVGLADPLSNKPWPALLTEATKPDIQQSNKRLKGSDGTASSIQSPTGSIKQQPSRPIQVVSVPETDPCYVKAAAAGEAARRSSNVKLFYMGIPEPLKVSSAQSIATRQNLAAHLNSIYDFQGIKCGKGLDLKVIFVDSNGKTAFFPAMSSAYHWQDGQEVLPDGTSWQDVSAKATALYVCQNEYDNLNLPSKGVPSLSKLQQLNLHAPQCH